MSTLPWVELGVLGPLHVRQGGAPVSIPGAKPRAILTMLGLHGGSVVSADTLVELLWGEDPPRTAVKALQTHISALRRTLGDGFVLTEGAGWTLAESEVDASLYTSAARSGREAAAAGDNSQAVTRFEEALALWRGIPELPDGRRGTSEKTRWIEGHATLIEDRAEALLATGRAAEVIGDLEAAVAEAPLRERRWGQLMLALYRAGRQGEALAAFQRARSLLAAELGVDPGPNLRKLEAAIVAQHASLDIAVAQQAPSVTRAVTFLLTDIEGSTAAWEADADAMAVALARHDELIEQVVTSQGGRLIKTRGEGDATFSVFERPSAAAAAAIELQEAIGREPWSLREPLRIRMALHTGEVELRDGDYFGRAVNRVARLRSLAVGGQILCSGATAELVIDSLRDDVVLTDLGMRELRNLARPEHVFELRLETADDHRQAVSTDTPLERPSLPAVLAGPGPFVGREHEFARLFAAWQTSLAGATKAVLIAGEPGVGKTRLAGEWSRQAYDQGALVIYGRCDEDLGAPYQPFAEALRALVPCLGSSRLRGMRGAEALLPLVPGLTDLVADLAAPARADPDTERYALFDAVVALLGLASGSAPVVLVLDDLHWAAKPTLLLLRHLLRFGEHARVQVLGTYRSTDLDRSHPLAATLADLHRDGTADRIALSGLDEEDVTAYVAEAGYDDEELARALASVTGGNPFFLIEALRHVDESGGHWDPGTLPQGVREAVSRRLTRLPAETNKALAAAAVVGSRFGLELVERVVEADLVDAFDEACKAGIVIEESSGHYRFNHAIVRQSLLAELPSVRRLRLHQRIATTLENEPGADDELLAELAHHYYECAWAGNAAKAVEYCRRAADQAVARLAYEGAADLYGHALHALEEIDEELPDRDDQAAELLVARCETLLAAGDVASAASAVSQLHSATVDSERLAAWATCFDGQLSILIHPERLDEVEAALATAARKLAELDDAAGEANAHTVRAACLARLGRIGDGEIALDDALTAARRACDHRRVNAVLAGAPLAALWGPNPVPRAGGRCLDVVRLLRITTDSPAVEATSTRCQAVLEAFRGRAEAARRMIDSARRTVTELGLRHALLEVEQFAGIVELVADDPAEAESHLRQAYNGFRRMGLDADTAETAALLGSTCLALDRVAEADELCSESERLAGHALKASIAWRTLRARLLSRGNDHDKARQVAQDAVRLAERTDALVDHGDACASLATVLGAAGDAVGARAAAERAVDLYERKGAAALVERARLVLTGRVVPAAAPPPEAPSVELDNACARAGRRAMAAVDRQEWDEFERVFAPGGSIESRRKIVGFKKNEFRSDDVIHQTRHDLESGAMRLQQFIIAVRGERLAIARMVIGTPDASPGAPQDEFLALIGIDDEGRIALQIWFDIDDVDAAMAELDAAHARFEEQRPKTQRPENTASLVIEHFLECFVARDWTGMTDLLADNMSSEDRRRVVNAGIRQDRDAELKDFRLAADLGVTRATSDVIATRGERLVLIRSRLSLSEEEAEAFQVDLLWLVQVNAEDRIAAWQTFDLDDFGSATAELDDRYLVGEAAAHAHTWSVIAGNYAAFNRRDLPAMDGVTADHRRGTPFASSDLTTSIRTSLDLTPDLSTQIEAVHRLSDLGAVVTHAANGTSPEGFDAEWREINLVTTDGDTVNRCELFDEADLDAAIARFDQLSRPARRLENAASRAAERAMSCFATRDWGVVGQVFADDILTDDRRRTANAGHRHGKDAEIENWQAAADVGFTKFTPTVVATRGERLALARFEASGRDRDAIRVEFLIVIGIDPEERIVTLVAFELDDFDAAIAEVDARYVAGEAASYGNVLRPVMDTIEELNRHKPGPMLRRLSFADHRRVPFGSAENYGRAIEELWTLVPDARYWTRAVHALDAHGLVSTLVIEGTDAHGNELHWDRTFLFLSDGPRVEVYDEDGIDAALARLAELRPQARRLDNAARQVAERHSAHFKARDWGALAEGLADDFVTEDRRRVVNAGIRHGRDAEIANWQAAADVGFTNLTPTVIATRGERLILAHLEASGRDPEATRGEFLVVIEIDADERVVAFVVFEFDDLEAAIAELDARYLAGEATPYAHTWSLVTDAYAAINRRELPALTPDWVNIDHRHGAAFAPGELTAFIHDWFDDAPDIDVYIEAVHRLNNLGVVVTHTAHGTSQEGFEAEWHDIGIYVFDGDLLSRCELFDEADLDAAFARFDELNRPAPQLENAASQVAERYSAYFASRDWHALREVLAVDFILEDRRRTINAGVRHGRAGEIASLRAMAEAGFTHMASVIVAVRGERLVLTRSSGRTTASDEFESDALGIVEIDSEDRIAAIVVFDTDDFDAALAELDGRYLAGEAAAYAHTWSVVAQGYAAQARGKLPAMTSDCATIDHRRAKAFAPGEMAAYIRAGWDLDQTIRTYVEVVHRLNDLGAVCTYRGQGVSQEGFDAEWREVAVTTVEGEIASRCELFDEADLDTAIARFQELHWQSRRLENTACQLYERCNTYFVARDWGALAKTFADDVVTEDRRRVVGIAVGHGREAVIATTRAIVDFGMTKLTSSVLATRGNRLLLARARFSGADQEPGAFHTDVLIVLESNADDRIAAHLVFDPDDFDAAIVELDARYLTGEATAHAHTWSVVAQTYTTLNKQQLPATTPDWINIDHRRLASIEAGHLAAYVRDAQTAMPGNIYIEAVHRLSDLGAVVTRAVNATSQDGFDAEWREIDLLTFQGDRINRLEVFDEIALDAVLAHFEELHPKARQLKNAVKERFLRHFEARDWDAMAEDFAEDYYNDDRRRVVNSGVRRGRKIAIEDLRAGVDVGLLTRIAVDIIATRGERLILTRVHNSGHNHDAVQLDMLQVVEYDADERIAAAVVFDPDDFAAAFTELDARYLAGEAAVHAHTWSVVAGVCAAFNRHEFPATTPGSTVVDHRSLISTTANDLPAFLNSAWDLTPEASIYIETVHRLSSFGAVATFVAYGSSPDGFAAEWRMIEIFKVDDDRLSRVEIFDEANLDAALARFDELHARSRCPDNTASRVNERVWGCYRARDWDAMAELLIDDFVTDDRRRVVNVGIRRGRDNEITDMQALAAADAMITVTVIATRGERLVLTRVCSANTDFEHGEFGVEILGITEIAADNRIAAAILFDPENLDAALAELDARYLAGEGALHAHTWSVVVAACAAFNRGAIDYTTIDSAYTDHRLMFDVEADGIDTHARAQLDVTPDARTRIEAVHRLSELGVVSTCVTKGASPEGFDAEWRTIGVFTIEGDRVGRCEVFDEEDLDAALARFDELHSRVQQLENAASRAEHRFFAYWGARNWAAMAEILADDSFIDDTKRNVANVGFWDGRDVVLANMRALADAAASEITTLTVIATRGERLVLTRRQSPNRDPQIGQFVSEGLIIAEIDNDGRIKAHVQFDVDDIDAAFEELDARYIAGDAAAHAHTWSLLAQVHVTLNRHEIPPTATGFVNIDHRRGIAFAPGEIVAFVRATFDDTPDVRHHIVAVHRLSDRGAVITQALHGTSREGLDAEWQNIALFIFEADLATRVEVFDEEDLDAALARFEELHLQTSRLENTAARVNERMYRYFAADDWAAIADIFADNIVYDDRRRVVNGGVWRGRDLVIENMRAVTDFAVENLGLIATRGERLALARWRWSNSDRAPESFHTEVLCLVEVDTEELIEALISFDPEDVNAVFEELDTRYLAGEAAAHAQTWSAVMQAYAAANRHELAAISPNMINIDHRRLALIESGDLTAYLRNIFQDITDLNTYLETVHRLTDRGAVVIHVGTGTSKDGFEADWRMVSVIVVENNLISRCEIFDEADLDAALARFDELQRPPRRLENIAIRVTERFWKYFAVREWTAMAELLADDISTKDRRRVVNAGVRHGRDVGMADMRAMGEMGANIAETAIAIRGEFLVLYRFSFFGPDQRPDAFHNEVLMIVEINADNRIASSVLFDLEDIDAAFEELDARYLAVEAAAHAHTWSVITRWFTAVNKHEVPPTTPDWAAIDHRRLPAFEGGDLPAALRAVWDVTPDLSIHIERVHRLSSFGVVAAFMMRGTSSEGLAVEWRTIEILTVEGDRIKDLEIFDEADLDAALARFEELQPPVGRLENTASQVDQRFWASIATRDWDAIAQRVANDICVDDRRKTVNAGVRRGREAYIADLRTIAEFSQDTTSTVVATRGTRLALTHIRTSNPKLGFAAELLCVVEIGADDRMVARIGFDVDDLNAAFEELDARYLVGEAAAHAQTFSVITRECAAFNEHELPAADWVTIDHRRLAVIDASEGKAAMRAIWDVTPDLTFRIEAVHRLSSFGAVAAYRAYGTSPEGFHAEWRMILLLAIEGDRIDHLEIFDEADLDAALARFDELQPQAPRPENAASQVVQHFLTHFEAREWDAIAAAIFDDIVVDDRRRVVNAGSRHGRDAEMANLRAIADVGVTNLTQTVIAVRGERLVLGRYFGVDSWSGHDQLSVCETNADNQIVVRVEFGSDDIDAAFKELEARYLAGEAAAHAHTWSVIAAACVSFNKHEVPATVPGSVAIEHRPLLAIDAADLGESIRAVWDLTPDARMEIEAVHRLNELGAVITYVLKGTSPEGFGAEWRMIDIFTVEGNSISCIEVFDEADLDAALARFDELRAPPHKLENTASRVGERFLAHFGQRDWDGMAEMLADDFAQDDRRRVVGAGVRHGRDAQIADLRVIAELRTTYMTSTVIATRGERLALTRQRLSFRDEGQEGFLTDVLVLAEINADERIVASVSFSPDDIDVAFAELDARYLAGEAAAHSDFWSVITRGYATLNNHELPPVTSKWVTVDHRMRATFQAADQTAYIRGAWDLTPNLKMYIEAVHRLSDHAAVVTHAAYGSTQEGFVAEWRMIGLLAAGDGNTNRCELFDETDLGTALARFDELQPPARRRLENAASQVVQRFWNLFADRDWTSMAETIADECVTHDRRRVVNADDLRGRAAHVTNMQAVAEVGFEGISSTVIATREQRHALIRIRSSVRGSTPGEVTAEMLSVVMLDTDNRLAASVIFDPDDVDAAFDELDALYLGGEAAAHPNTWSVITGAFAAMNRRELPAAAPGWVNVDHRRLATIESGDLIASLRALWELMSDLSFRVEAVHRLSHLGALFTRVAKGTSHDGLDAEWRCAEIMTVDGEAITRVEVFDEANFDAALARFDELDRPAPTE